MFAIKDNEKGAEIFSEVLILCGSGKLFSLESNLTLPFYHSGIKSETQMQKLSSKKLNTLNNWKIESHIQMFDHIVSNICIFILHWFNKLLLKFLENYV